MKVEQGRDHKPNRRWIKHYCSSHKILLVGEGDFSFAACLANAFESGTNIIATTLDSKEKVLANYSNAERNLKALEEFGCCVVYEVDVHTMKEHPLLGKKLFDRIVFNFPHAGFHMIWREHDGHQIRLHRGLVKGFIESAKDMLAARGEIHITHKTAYPFSKWKIVELAEKADLRLLQEATFERDDYPGYINKRGSGPQIDATFPVGECKTFKFAQT